MPKFGIRQGNSDKAYCPKAQSNVTVGPSFMKPTFLKFSRSDILPPIGSVPISMFSKPASNPYMSVMSRQYSTNIASRAHVSRTSVRQTVLMMSNNDIEKKWVSPINEIASKKEKVQIPNGDIEKKFKSPI